MKAVIQTLLYAAPLAVALTLVQVKNAEAFKLFGQCFFGSCKKDDKAERFIDPKTYDVEFSVDELAPDDIAQAVRAASELWQGREKPVGGSAGLVARAKGDYRRILAALYGKGRYAGIISIKVNGVEASNIKPGRDIPGHSNVVISVDPDVSFAFGTALVINPAPFTADPKDQTKSLAEIGFVPGAVAEAGAVHRAAKVATEAWRQQGYPTARVENRSATAVHPDQRLNVKIRIAPGPPARFGNVVVEGTERMDAAFVAYMTGLVPGKEYDPDDIIKAEKRLDQLGVFSTRKIKEAKSVNANGLLPIDVIVSERKLRRIGVGATLSSIDGVGVGAYWLHRNIFGKAERLRFDAKVGRIGNTADMDKLDYLLSATLTQPGFFSPDTDLVWNAYGKKEFNDTYTENSTGGLVSLTNYWSDELTFSAGIFGKYGKFDDVFGQHIFLTTGFLGDATYDSRDSKVDPIRGFYAQFKARPYYEWEFGNAAARLEAELRSYCSFGTDDHNVVAGRIKVGSLVGSSIVETPPDLLFTAGGGDSVRGYSYKSIGLPFPDGGVSGGRSLIEGSLEFRRRLNESFGAVAFADAGTVGSSSFSDFSDFSEDFKISVGVGVRYYTGLGPIRLDVAFPLNGNKNDADFAIYAGIGQAF